MKSIQWLMSIYLRSLLQIIGNHIIHLIYQCVLVSSSYPFKRCYCAIFTNNLLNNHGKYSIIQSFRSILFMIEEFSASFTLIFSINYNHQLYSGSNYLNRHNQKKSSMKEKRHYSIDDRSISRKVEDTTKERSGIQRLKKTGKIEEKYEIDLFAKTPSQLESSIYALEQRIRQLEGERRKFAELLNQQNNQKIISLFIRTYEKIQDQLDQLNKELQTKKDKKLNAVQQNDAAYE